MKIIQPGSYLIMWHDLTETGFVENGNANVIIDAPVNYKELTLNTKSMLSIPSYINGLITLTREDN